MIANPGVTVFNGMRNMQVQGGGICAIQGLGGLGHLAVQYARKMGFRTVALSRGTAKKEFASQLGATDYIDTEAHSAAEELQKMGGADMIVVTAPNPDIISPLLGGLAPMGTLRTCRFSFASSSIRCLQFLRKSDFGSGRLADIFVM